MDRAGSGTGRLLFRTPGGSGRNAAEERAERGWRLLTSTWVHGLLTRRGRVGGLVRPTARRCRPGLMWASDGRRSLVAREVAAPDRERHGGGRRLLLPVVRDSRRSRRWASRRPRVLGIGRQLPTFSSEHGVTCSAISVNLDQYEGMSSRRRRRRFIPLFRRHLGFVGLPLCRRHADERLFGSDRSRTTSGRAAGPGSALVGDSRCARTPGRGRHETSRGVQPRCSSRAIC